MHITETVKRHLPGSALISVLAVLTLFSCKSQYEALLAGNDVEAKYKAAFEYFNQGKFQRSAQLFESLALATEGTERNDTVQYYWALSNYSNNDYYTAETNFERFLSSYPSGPFSESATFLRIDCLYKQTHRYELDQTPTYKAMTNINEYLMDHPEGANADMCRKMLEDLELRLDRKAFESARLYYKIEDYKAARVALRNILKDDSENVYREDILYYMAMSSYKYANLSVAAKQKERFIAFREDYLNFIEEYPESRYRKELDVLYKKVTE